MATKSKATSRRTAPPKAATSKKKNRTPSPKKVATAPARAAALERAFAALGAKAPRTWANRQVETGTDEIGRFVLLRALGLRAVEPGRLLGRARKDKIAGAAVDRLLASTNIADLDALVRFAQREALQDACRVLDDPADNEDGIRWAVFRVDAKGLPLWSLEALGRDLEDAAP